MQAHYDSISETYELVFHLLSLSFFYGDFSIPYHFMNATSQAHLSVKKKDIAALRRFAARNWISIADLSPEKQLELEQIFEIIKNKYGERLQTELSPLPNEFLIDLGERAINFGKFRDAHSALKQSGNLEKKVNQLLVEAVQLIQSREVTAADIDENTFVQKLAQAADLVFQACKLKNPFGNQFQRLGPKLHYEDAEAARKYGKYIEQSLFKEIIEIGIQYLIDDKSIDNKIINVLSSGKIRREFFKQLAMRFSGGKDQFEAFLQNYQQAAAKLPAAKAEADFLEIQKTLLGRGTGDNEYYQFLRELSVEHPIGALLVTTSTSPQNKPFITPIILKSGMTLLEFLELK